MSHAILHNDWKPLLEGHFRSPSYLGLRAFLIKEYRTYVVHPDMHDIFNALHFTSYADTRVLILGQDPYHGMKQAHGLSFSVQRPTPAPPSLANIFREMHNDLGIRPPNHGDLTQWAKQGVLLLNTVLTVRHAYPNSHQNKGWEAFTDAVIAAVNDKSSPVVFILWGRAAQAKRKLVTHRRHHLICSSHPSPLSAHNGFFGSKPFSRANRFLSDNGLTTVCWDLG